MELGTWKVRATSPALPPRSESIWSMLRCRRLDSPLVFGFFPLVLRTEILHITRLSSGVDSYLTFTNTSFKSGVDGFGQIAFFHICHPAVLRMLCTLLASWVATLASGKVSISLALCMTPITMLVGRHLESCVHRVVRQIIGWTILL